MDKCIIVVQLVNNMENTKIINFLRRLGLSKEEALIYLVLTEQGICTPLTLSRTTKINRTKVYRTLESMQKKQLVQEEVLEHSTQYSPAPVEQVKRILKSKQERVVELARDMTQIEDELAQLGAKKEADTKVRFYRGREGIRQMVWSVLKAKTEIVGYTHTSFEKAVGGKFVAEFYEEFLRRNLKFREIISDSYLNSVKAEDETKQDYRNNPKWESNLVARYLPENVLSTPHQMDIYDDVVSFYRWEDGEVWGTEIYNPHVASMQRQLFELAWERAK